MAVIEAEVLDSTHLKLTRPIQIPNGARILVSIANGASLDQERQEWLGVSMHNLEAAYAPDEPDYSLTLIKKPNPHFEP